MRGFLSFLIVFVLSLFQAGVLAINFLLIFVILKNSYFWAFLAGLVFDLLSLQRLGLSSLLFLVILGLFRLYSRKFEPRLSFLVPFVFLASFFFAKIEEGVWHLGHGLVLVASLWPLREKFKEEKQLKLEI